MTSRDFFKDKRIAVIGLGPHGEMVTDVKFMIKAGSLVAVYDMRSEARLKNHLVFLRSIGLANYVCGSIPSDDLLDMDLIILSSEYPRESTFLKPAKDKGIPIEYPETFFFKQAPPVTLIGVMGSCGKATIVSMLAPMLEATCSTYDNQGFFMIDPEMPDGIISNLKIVKSGDIVLARIVEPMMRELYDIRISPHVGVFTTVPEKGSYSDSPFEVLTYQTYNNFIVGSDQLIDSIRLYKFQPKGKMLRTKTSLIPADWVINGRGVHDRDNAALALQTAHLFKVTDEVAREALEKWKSLKGRLEPIKRVKHIEFYNDSASVSPDSTLMGVKTLSENRNVVLIFGGANSGADFKKLYAELPQFAHTLVSLPGSGTLVERNALSKLENIDIKTAPTLEEAVRVAFESAKKGDRVLFSPGFEAGGMDVSRKERGERFVRAVRSL